jgi:OmpA-OmpF porin, OOP family
MKYFFLIPLLCCLHVLQAQNGKYWEAGFLLGATNYSGDLSYKPVSLSNTYPGYGAYMRRFFNRSFSVKAHAYSGAISGDDKGAPYEERSFRFSSNITELGLVGEVHLFTKDRFSKTGLHSFAMSPYLYAGVGITFANPDAEYYGPPDRRNDFLRVPLPEEGLDHRFLLAPMGAGLRFDIYDYLVLGLEGGFRPVFSDDLDGVRVNGNPNNGDWYYFAGTTISFILSRPKRRK